MKSETVRIARFFRRLLRHASLGLIAGAVLFASPTRAGIPLTHLGLLAELEQSIRYRDDAALRSLHSWDGVTGRYHQLSDAHIRRLLDLELKNVYLEPFDNRKPVAGLRYNVEPHGNATIEFADVDGGIARMRLPFGKRDGRLYLAMLVGTPPVMLQRPAAPPVANAPVQQRPAATDSTRAPIPGVHTAAVTSDQLTIDVRVSALGPVPAATYDIACVVETGTGLQTVTYSAHGGTVRRLPGRRFKSCGMRVSGTNAPNIELWLREGARVVYRSGKLSGPGTVVYRPNT